MFCSLFKSKNWTADIVGPFEATFHECTVKFLRFPCKRTDSDKRKYIYPNYGWDLFKSLMVLLKRDISTFRAGGSLVYSHELDVPDTHIYISLTKPLQNKEGLDLVMETVAKAIEAGRVNPS